MLNTFCKSNIERVVLLVMFFAFEQELFFMKRFSKCLPLSKMSSRKVHHQNERILLVAK